MKLILLSFLLSTCNVCECRAPLSGWLQLLQSLQHLLRLLALRKGKGRRGDRYLRRSDHLAAGVGPGGKGLESGVGILRQDNNLKHSGCAPTPMSAHITGIGRPAPGGKMFSPISLPRGSTVWPSPWPGSYSVVKFTRIGFTPQKLSP